MPLKSALSCAVFAAVLVVPAHAGPPRRLPLDPGDGGPHVAAEYVMLGGNVRLRLTDRGCFGGVPGEPPPAVAAQWPGLSGMEYLTSIRLVVAAKNPEAPSPATVHRASMGREWQPRTPAEQDGIHVVRSAHFRGQRFVDDDGDGRIDEEFLDGHDDDGDGSIDEDFEMLGDEMASYVMRDDTDAAIDLKQPEPHVPFGLECTVRAWTYVAANNGDFVVLDFRVKNVADHQLDSLTIGWVVASGCGSGPARGLDDRILPTLPSASMVRVLDDYDPRRQLPHSPLFNVFVPPESALCPRRTFRTVGFSLADGVPAPAVASILLADQTLDPFGYAGPRRRGFRACRYYVDGVPEGAGGLPETDLSLYRALTEPSGVDTAGVPTGPVVLLPGNPVVLCSIGPYLSLDPGQGLHATIVLAVQPESSAVNNAYRIARLADGDLVPIPEGMPGPDLHGRETPLIAPPGMRYDRADCRDEVFGQSRAVEDDAYTSFDFDCDFCTGVYQVVSNTGLFARSWIEPAPVVSAPEYRAVALQVGPGVPNPSRGDVRFAIEGAGDAPLRVRVLDASGRVVRDFAAGGAGIRWDGRDAGGRRAPPGVYWLEASTPEQRAARKLVLLP